ncbi:hypothetical protein HY633_03455 [Candidatus Uhrbacteria bacterium]|nr:hypothetical protein [Candidatus Uhrbacteria bacterium]
MEKETKTQKWLITAALLLSFALALVLVSYTAGPAADMLLKMTAAKPSAESVRRQNAFWRGYNTGDFPDGEGYGTLGVVFRIYLVSPEERHLTFAFDTFMAAHFLVATKDEATAMDSEAAGSSGQARVEKLKKFLKIQRRGNDFLERILADKERMDAALAGKEVPLLPEPTQ